MARLDDEITRHLALAKKRPDDTRVAMNLGRLYQRANNCLEAMGWFSRCIAADPRNVDAWTRTGYCLMHLFKIKEALDTFTLVLQLQPAYTDALLGQAICAETLGDPAGAMAMMERAIQLAPDGDALYPFRAYLVATYGNNPAASLAAFRDWGRRFADPLTRAAREPRNDLAPGRKLRVGYVSADLRDHSVAYFVEPIFARHERRKFDVCVFASGPADHVTTRLRAGVDQWFDVSAMNDENLAGLIRRQKIDILVDLSGHTMGNRLLAFARRPAPVQATWIGFMYTTGMQAMDYRLTDFNMDPVGKNDAAHSEALFRLQRSACYLPPPDTPLATEAPMVAGGRPVFASLNNLKKVTDEALLLWRRILERVPESILILIGYERTQEEAIAQQQQRLAAAGLPLERLCILPRLSVGGFMQLGLKADVALDTFPISGGTTTLHSLWMGLPVVALAGSQAFASSTSSILRGFGLDDLVANDADAYVAKAIALARDPGRLSTFRATIRERMQKSMMMDYAAYVRDLEAAYRLMWLNHVTGCKRHLDTTVDLAAALADCEHLEDAPA